MSFKKITIFVLLITAVISAHALKPTLYLASTRQDFKLEQVIPQTFGDWSQIENGGAHVINPQQEELVNKLYAQTLSRTYTNKKGYLVMLTIAYGEDQSDNTQLHYPEVCYPAQGFQISHKQKGQFQSVLGPLRIKELVATISSRVEPIIYWTTVGEKNATGGFESKLIKIDYGLHGIIPDGLLFRISSINPDTHQAFKIEKEFANQLISSINPKFHPILTGLPSKP